MLCTVCSKTASRRKRSQSIRLLLVVTLARCKDDSFFQQRLLSLSEQKKAKKSVRSVWWLARQKTATSERRILCRDVPYPGVPPALSSSCCSLVGARQKAETTLLPAERTPGWYESLDVEKKAKAMLLWTRRVYIFHRRLWSVRRAQSGGDRELSCRTRMREKRL